MFSLQQIFGKGDRFQHLLEEAAVEAHESVKIVISQLKKPSQTRTLDDMVLLRRKEKKIAEQISEELVSTFVTGLDREDIEALSRALYRIPKSSEKLAERLHMAGNHLDGMDLTQQAEMMVKATEVVVEMVKQLRDLQHLDQIKELNDRLQYVEGEADKLMFELLKDLYSGRHEALKAIVIRDLYELMEKVIDRCRDAGNVVSHIVMKNS